MPGSFSPCGPVCGGCAGGDSSERGTDWAERIAGRAAKKPRGTIASKRSRRAEKVCRRFDEVMDLQPPQSWISGTRGVYRSGNGWRNRDWEWDISFRTKIDQRP